jgi:hypothetical protein
MNQLAISFFTVTASRQTVVTSFTHDCRQLWPPSTPTKSPQKRKIVPSTLPTYDSLNQRSAAKVSEWFRAQTSANDMSAHQIWTELYRRSQRHRSESLIPVRKELYRLGLDLYRASQLSTELAIWHSTGYTTLFTTRLLFSLLCKWPVACNISAGNLCIRASYVHDSVDYSIVGHRQPERYHLPSHNLPAHM